MAYYVFPGIMYHRFKNVNAENCKHDSEQTYFTPTLQNSYAVYQLCMKQYLGFGALLQFIPGTNAYATRKQLSNDLELVIVPLKNAVARQPSFMPYGNFWEKEYYWFKKKALLASLDALCNFSFLFRLFDEVVKDFRSQGIDIKEKLPLIRIVFTSPILNDFFEVTPEQKIRVHNKALANVLHSMINPGRILDDLLNFLHLLVYRLIDIGAEQNAPSSTLRILFKGSLGGILGIIKIPVKVLKHTIDLTLKIMKMFIIAPVMHLASSIKSAYHYRGKNILVATKKEFHDIKMLRRAAKGREDISYYKITKPVDYTSEYVGITKEELYCKHRGADRLQRIVAVRASTKKIASMTSLLSVVSFFNAKKMTMKNAPEAIVEAQKILML